MSLLARVVLRMRFVRCEECGAKALIAASQCPRCTHPLELRDTRGVPVALAHCRKCDTYYPRSRGGCKWCGTTAPTESSRSLPAIGGIAALVVLAGIGVWFYQGRAGTTGRGEAAEGGETVVAAQAAPAPQPPPVSEAVPDSAAGVVTPIDSAPPVVTSTPAPRPVTPAPGSNPSAPPVSASAPPPVTQPAPQPVSTPPITRPAPLVAPTVPTTAGEKAPVPQPPPTSVSTPVIPTGPIGADRYAGPWTRAVALEWVNVRGSPAREAGIVGVVTPNTRVLLGDVRVGWRRVRAAGFEGWADSRFFAADSARR